MLTSFASAPPPIQLRSPTGAGRPYPPELVASVRALIERAGLSQREAAARAGVGVDAVGRWARRFGWRRANVAFGASVACEVVGTALAEVGSASVRAVPNFTSLSAHPGGSRGPARGWVPAGESRYSAGTSGGRVHSRKIRPDAEPVSGGGRPPRPHGYGPDVREAARVRVEGTRDGLERIATELGIARWTLHGWAKRSGWRRPAPPERPGPTGTVGATGTVGPIGTVGPMFDRSRRFGRPYGGDATSIARDLLIGSILPLHRIAARAGVSRATLCRWIATRGWRRPSAVARRRRDRPPYPPAVVAEPSSCTGRRTCPPRRSRRA